MRPALHEIETTNMMTNPGRKLENLTRYNQALPHGRDHRPPEAVDIEVWRHERE